MDWSPEQEAALKSVKEWLVDKDRKIFRLYGYAGTGKTTVAKSLVADVSGHVQFGAFTGKAADVMRSKGMGNAKTLHSLMYRVETVLNEHGKEVPQFVLDKSSILANTAVLVVDEASMVGQHMVDDLMTFPCKILVIGDPGQLPPVMGKDSFTSVEPDALLTEIHRQAKGDPIIELSMRVRTGAYDPDGEFEKQFVIKVGDREAIQQRMMETNQALCGTNKSRSAFNLRYRSLKGIIDKDPGRAKHFPLIGERLVCLKNNAFRGIYNGATYTLKRYEEFRGFKQPGWEYIILHGADGSDYDAVYTKKTWMNHRMERWEHAKSDRFDFGYVLTVHKSQGSQWDDVLVFNEGGKLPAADSRKWLYTGVTRAAKKLTIVEW